MISKVEPKYTEEARAANKIGSVYFRGVIDESGMPTDLVLIRGLGYGLDEKALEAVKQWRFSPAMNNGQPFKWNVTLQVRFKYTR